MITSAISLFHPESFGSRFVSVHFIMKSKIKMFHIHLMPNNIYPFMRLHKNTFSLFFAFCHRSTMNSGFGSPLMRILIEKCSSINGFKRHSTIRWDWGLENGDCFSSNLHERFLLLIGIYFTSFLTLSKFVKLGIVIDVRLIYK